MMEDLTDWNIKRAVTLWCNSRREAEERFGHISRWNTSRVTNMENLFHNQFTFNDDLSQWNVSRVTNMKNLFDGASSFNQSMNDWDVSNVKQMSGMFRGASLFNQPLDRWNVNNVTTMLDMFSGAASFNQPIGNWNVRNVTDMRGMFYGATEFNQPLNDWSVIKVIDQSDMFRDARSFNRPLNRWTVPNVRDRTNMFAGAINFAQAIPWLRNPSLPPIDENLQQALIDAFNGLTIDDVEYRRLLFEASQNLDLNAIMALLAKMPRQISPDSHGNTFQRITTDNCRSFGLQHVNFENDLNRDDNPNYLLFSEPFDRPPLSRVIAMEWKDTKHATYIFQFEPGQGKAQELVHRLNYFIRLFKKIPRQALFQNFPIQRLLESIRYDHRANFEQAFNRALAIDGFNPSVPGVGISNYCGYLCRVLHDEDEELFKTKILHIVQSDANELRQMYPYQKFDDNHLMNVEDYTGEDREEEDNYEDGEVTTMSVEDE